MAGEKKRKKDRQDLGEEEQRRCLCLRQATGKGEQRLGLCLLNRKARRKATEEPRVLVAGWLDCRYGWKEETSSWTVIS